MIRIPVPHPPTIDMLVVVALTVLASADLIGVYGSVSLWAGSALPAALCGVAAAGAFRRPGGYRWCRSVAGLAGAQCVLGPVVAGLPGVTWRNGPAGWTGAVSALLGRSVMDGWRMVGASFRIIVAFDSPFGMESGALLVVWTVCLWAAFLAGCAVLARPVHRGFVVLVVAFVMGEFVLCALLGATDGRHLLWIGVVMALLLLWWCSLRRCGRGGNPPGVPGEARRPDGSACSGVAIVDSDAVAFPGGIVCPKIAVRLAAVMRLAAVSVTAAVIVCVLVPQHRFTLRNVLVPDTFPYAYTSPLSGMRSVIRDHRDEVLVTVTGLPSGTCVRLAVMDDFDGSVWNLAVDVSPSAFSSDGPASGGVMVDGSRSATGSSVFRRIVSSVGSSDRPEDADASRYKTDAVQFSALFTIHDGLSGPWLPVAGTVSSVRIAGGSGSQTGAAAVVYGNRDTGSFIVPSWPSNGWDYAVDGVIAPEPSPADIEAADAARVVQPQVRNVPDSVETLARSVAGGASDGEIRGGRAAGLLASWLREHGWFSHGLSDDYPSAPGHGNRRLASMAEDVMVGDSEQYASLMALMARSLGLPSRVVLGFVPDDDDASLVEFTGDDLEAWVEIALKGWGWVAFHPTPKESQAFDGGRTGSERADRRLYQPSPPLVDPPGEEPRSAEASTLGGERAERPDRKLTGMAGIVHAVLSVVVRAMPIWLPLLAAALIPAWKALMRSRARDRGPPRTRILAAWQSVCDVAVDVDVPVQGTRRDQAAMLADRFPAWHDTLLRLAGQADRAAFSPYSSSGTGPFSADGPRSEAGSMAVSVNGYASAYVPDSIRDEDAAACWRVAEVLRRMMFDAQPPLRRLAAWLSLRSLASGHRLHAPSRSRNTATARSSRRRAGP